MIDILMAPMGKSNNMQEQMGNTNREMETKKEIKRKCQKSYTQQQKVKNAFDGLLCTSNTAEDRVTELEDRSIETTQTEYKDIKE